MQSTPEKDVADPLMSGLFHRPRSIAAGQHDRSDVTVLEFAPGADDFPVSTFADRFAWASVGWKRFTPTMRDRLLRIVRRLCATDEMSGMVCLQHILAAICHEINRHVENKDFSVPLHSVTDVKPHCRLVAAKGFLPKYKPAHIHSGIEERMPLADQEKVLFMLPPTECWLEAKRLQCQKVGEYVTKVFTEKTQRCLHAPCDIHGTSCPVRPLLAHGLDSFEVDPHSDTTRDLLMNSSGIVCKDFSSYGSLEGTGGKSMMSQNVWVAERRVAGEKLCLAECVLGWNSNPAAKALRSSMRGFDAVLCPTQIGDCIHRKRRVLTLIENEAPNK